MSQPPETIDPARVRLTGHDLRRLADMLHATSLQLAFERGAHPALDRVVEVASACETLAARLLPQPAARPIEPVNTQLARLSAAIGARLPPGIELDLVLGDEPLWLRAAPEQFEEVVLALVANAFAAMHAGGRLTIELHRPVGLAAAQLVISDTGAGFDMALHDRIFEPFYTTTGGVGLGLCGVREIMTAARGSLRVQSAPGVGTRFEMNWPLRPAEAATSGTSPRGHAVLVIEADPAVRAALATVLRGAGHTVTVAAQVMQARGWLARGGLVELIVTDVPFESPIRQLVLADAGAEGARRLRRPVHPERLLARIVELIAEGDSPDRG